MKKLSAILVFSLVSALFTHTLTYSRSATDVRVGYIYDDIQLSLDHQVTASLEDFASKYELDKIFVSEEFYGDFEFNAVGLEWYEEVPTGTTSELYIRFLQDAGWSGWTELEKDIDDRGDSLGSAYSFVMTDTSEAFQYKVVMHSEDGYATPYLANIEFQYLDSTPAPDRSPLSFDLKKLTFNAGGVDVISRSQWGADESYRYYGGDENDLEDDDGLSSAIETKFWGNSYSSELAIKKTVTTEDSERLSWALEYPEDVDKIIIHHTATTSNLDDPEAAIRAIYYYHAITRGWGDIGYNYVIDQYGNVYEGRYGGEGVTGGHTAGYNVGSVGIAMLGNFQDEPITYEALVSLMSLIDEISGDFDIDVDGRSSFRGEIIPNVIGHRDADATLCPGQHVYDVLPQIRDSVAGAGATYSYSKNTEFAYQTSSDWEPVYMTPEDEVTVTFSLKNVGTTTWDSDTHLISNKDYDADLVVDLNKDAITGIAAMNENEVKPGSTATFDVTLNSTIVGGFVSFDVTPVFNGYKKTSNYISLPVYVEFPDLHYDISDIKMKSSRLESGKTMDVTIKLTNTGNTTWSNSGDYLATLKGENLLSSVLMTESSVNPGGTATFEFSIKGPTAAGNYIEDFTLSFGDIGVGKTDDDSSFYVLVYNNSQQAEFTESSDKTEFSPGEQAEVWITLMNTGYQTWTSDNMTVSFVKYTEIGIKNSYLVESSVEEGESGKIKFTITAPDRVGNYKIYIKPRVDGRNLSQESFYYEFSVVPGDSAGYGEPDVRVALSYDGSEPSITANGDFAMYSADKVISEFSQDDSVEISFDGVNFQAKSGTHAWILNAYPVFVPDDENVIMEIEDFENRPAWNESLNDNMFRGNIEVQEIDGEIIVINELPLEDYVKGIAEVSNGDPSEKLKTMAILARTYALYYIYEDEKFPGFPYHLNDDPEYCQKYLGYGYELRSSNMAAAVKATDGLVVTYDGDLVKTPYFNSTDGTYTKSAQEVWGWTNTPWLVSVADPLCESTAFSGHGVGLSGCGAQAAAENGSTYNEIIQYYYNNVEITHLSDL